MPPAPCHTPARAISARLFPLNRRPAQGFTLVEILTATAIMTLIISLVMVILTQVMSAWNRSSDDLTFSTNARFVFDTITQDMQGLILRSDGNQWLSLTTDNPPTGANIPAAADSRLIFFTSTPMHQSKDNANPGGVGKTIAGDICAVEYRVVYADPFGTPPAPGAGTTTNTFSLHRVVIDPVSTFYGVSGVPIMGLNYNTHPTNLVDAFNTGIDLASAATTPTSNATPVVGIPFGGSAGPSALTIPIYGAYSTSNTLLDNIAQFTVYLYFTGQDPAGALPIQSYPQSTVTTTIPPSIYYGGVAAPTRTAGYLDGMTDAKNPPVFLSLAYADITLTILTDDGVAALQQGNGALPQNVTWPQFLQKFGKTFTQRVPLLVAPH